ncbi:MAG: radical SAM protein [Pirellulales bacterium]|nr:radical SAM protein [Pirellulales bacterium]
MTRSLNPSSHGLFEAHSRRFETHRYVYPVLSRRSRGISIGVNLNLDKRCNFDCVYCQVDRAERNEGNENQPLDVDRLAEELDYAIGLVTSGRLFERPKFADTPEPLRRLNDIALSGDGEPTSHGDFPKAVDICAEARRRSGMEDLRLVLITNASQFGNDAVRRSLDVLDANHGEIWAKLDAGTEACYRRVNRSAVPFQRILDNLAEAARKRPITIQTLFTRIDGNLPSDNELTAYGDRLREIVAAGGLIKNVQIHTVARRPAESSVTALSNREIDAIGDRVRRGTGLVVETFYA